MVSTTEPLLSLRGLRKQYGGAGGVPAVEVLHGIDLDIYAGEFVAIVGQSGSGKSTLMHLLGCLDTPSSGTYHFQGQNVASLNHDELAWLRRHAFGFVFQGYHLIATDSAVENVELPAVYEGLASTERRTQASALLTRLGLGSRLANRPHQLSGGQQQRVSIARALMNGGRIILADEPTGALDSQSGAEVMALFHELAAAGHTIILITHDRGVAEQAQRIIELHDGDIVSDSGHAHCHSLQQTKDPHLQFVQAVRLVTVPHDELPALSVVDGNAVNPAVLSAEPAVTLSPVQSQQINLFHFDLNQAQQRHGWYYELREALSTSWRGMCINRARTFLTLLGVIIGVASVIVMLAVGEGARQKVMEQMGTMGTTIMYMSGSRPPEGGPRGVLSTEDLDAVEGLADIARLMAVIGDPLEVRYSNAARSVYVFAGNEQMPSIHHWKVAEGRFYSRAENMQRSPVVVLGHKTKQYFFPDSNPIGKQLLIANSSFEVIGVMTERGADSGAESYDDMLFIPYFAGTARVYTAQEQPDYVVMEAVSSDRVHEAEAAVRTLLLSRHGGREDFSIGNAAARLQAESETQRSMTIMLGLIAAVSLIVGGIGVMNVMLMAVKERTREIGIRIAVGARQRDVLRLFLTEAVLLTFVGGLLGLAVAVCIGTALLSLQIPLVFSIRAMLGAVLCALSVGVFFGFMPARSAARLNPVSALQSP